MTDILVPELGESIIDGTLTSWLVKENESFKSGDNLAEIETDKITIEIPAQADGVMKKIITQSGENVKVGQIIAEFETTHKKETQNINKKVAVPSVNDKAFTDVKLIAIYKLRASTSTVLDVTSPSSAHSPVLVIT